MRRAAVKLNTKRVSGLFILLAIAIVVGCLVYRNVTQKKNASYSPLHLTFDEKVPDGLQMQTEEMCAIGKCVLINEGKSVSTSTKQTSPLTMLAWVRPTGTASASFLSLRHKKDDYLDVKLEGKTGKLSVSLKNGPKVTTANPLELALWQQIGVVVDGSSLRVYVNGSLEGKEDLAKDYKKFEVDELVIGPAVGFVDDVNINSAVLSDQEIIDSHAKTVLGWRGE